MEELQNVPMIMSTTRLAKNNDSETCYSILQAPHLMGANGVKCEFRRFRNVAVMISAIRLARDNDSDAWDTIFQTVHLMGRNGVKDEFHRKNTKMSLT